MIGSATRDGWVWINLDVGHASPLAEWIGSEIALDLGQFRMEDMNLHEVLEKGWDQQHTRFVTTSCFPNTIFNCNPPPHSGLQPDSDRRRPDEVSLLRADLRRRSQRPGLRRVLRSDIYQQLARTKRSSAYTQNILSEPECKIAPYHETMARLIRR